MKEFLKKRMKKYTISYTSLGPSDSFSFSFLPLRHLFFHLIYSSMASPLFFSFFFSYICGFLFMFIFCFSFPLFFLFIFIYYPWDVLRYVLIVHILIIPWDVPCYVLDCLHIIHEMFYGVFLWYSLHSNF